jgi:deazaflavin-dependent oxidoreductase (nitroreductase family)
MLEHEEQNNREDPRRIAERYPDTERVGDHPKLVVVPLPSPLKKFNRQFTNKVMGPLAKVMPTFGVIHHVGRKSGREYRTPVNTFSYLDGRVFALTYGRNTDWVKNVFAANGCRLETRGRIMDLKDPQYLPTAEGLQAVPALVHLALNGLNVTDFLYLKEVGR